MAPYPAKLTGPYDYCARLTRSHYENFPVASVLVPSRLRPHVCAVYAFARRADDFADEARYEGRRMQRLEGWGRLLERAASGHSVSHPIFAALAHTMKEFGLSPQPLRDLLSAFRQDVDTIRYRTFADLADYCRRSADPVGRLVLALFGYRDSQWDAWSDHICTALQLANFWQDVTLDAAKGRIYIPQEDLARFDVAEADVLNGVGGERAAALIRFQVERTREMFHAGRPLCERAPGRLGLELKAIWLGGMGILDAVDSGGDRVLTRRPAHGTAERVRFMWNTLVPGAFSRSYPVGHA